MIVGIDEVGRGAWAGPLVVGAVLLQDTAIEGLTDSKLLTRIQREVLDREIRKRALAVGLGWVSAKHIDQIGLTEALKIASRRAMTHIRMPYDEIIIDGTVRFLETARVMKKADLLIPSVSAASIVAKVARDNYMSRIDTVFPGYGFESHVGYGTVKHRKAIADLGVTPLHRISYEPLAPYRRPVPQSVIAQHVDKNEYELIAGTLKSDGHRIMPFNQQTVASGIDVISIKNGALYFTSTKHQDASHLSDSLARKELKQMYEAAKVYIAQQGYYGCEIRLQAATVKTEPLEVTSVSMLTV